MIDKVYVWLTIWKRIQWQQAVVELCSGHQFFSTNDGCRRTGARKQHVVYLIYISPDRFFAIITNERVDTVDFARVPQARNLWWKNSWENYIPQRKRCFEAKTFAEQVKRLDHYSVHFLWNEALTWSTSRKINDWKMKIITLINSVAIKLLFYWS